MHIVLIDHDYNTLLLIFQSKSGCHPKKLNNNQIGTLTALSDTLLPRFMSGKMEIKG